MKLRAVVMLLSVVGTAGAATLTFNDRAVFNAAAGPLTTLTFAGIAPAGGFSTFHDAAGLSLSGVNFVGQTDSQFRLYVVDDTFCCATYNRGQQASVTGPLQGNDGTNARIQVTLPANVYAVGFDLFSVLVGNGQGTNSDLLKVSVGGVDYNVTTQIQPGLAFIGFVSDTPISGLSVHSAPQNTAIDLTNFSFGGSAPSAVPEPSSVLLMLTGSIGLLLRLRSKRTA